MIPENVESYKKIMRQNFSGLTPLDIAGQHGCHEAAMMIINFLTKKFHFINEIYQENQKKSKNQITNIEMQKTTPINENDDEEVK